MLLRAGVVVLVLGLPFAVTYAEQPAGSSSQNSEFGLIKVPPSAVPVGKSVVDEVRAFPEMGKGQSKAQMEKIVGVEGVDRVFQTDRPFADTVAFFDQQFKQPGFKQLARVETQSATAWTVKRPDGTVANAVVRNTKPTTLELAEATATELTLPQHQR
jgi:hypothetical protein